jgi:hypothetical protein
VSVRVGCVVCMFVWGEGVVVVVVVVGNTGEGDGDEGSRGGRELREGG